MANCNFTISADVRNECRHKTFSFFFLLFILLFACSVEEEEEKVVAAFVITQLLLLLLLLLLLFSYTSGELDHDVLGIERILYFTLFLKCFVV